MKETKFNKKDGSEGTSYKFEAGDKVVANFDAPKKLEGGKYDNWSIGVKLENGEDIYVQLTGAQATKLTESGDIRGKTITAYEYENKYGKQIGVKVE